jgi:hypothetical protein
VRLSVAGAVRRILARNPGAHIVVDELHIIGSGRTAMDISPMALNHTQRRAIGLLASEYGGSLITMPYVGPKTIVALIKLGLIEIAPHNFHGEPRYRLTKTGNNMHEELSRFMLIPR